jgi:CRP/FNR family transcriptional regulator
MKNTFSQQLVNFFASGDEESFVNGEIITHGDYPSGVFLITSGFVKVYSISDKGDKCIHIVYQSGEVFPLIWAFNGIRRRVFYEAITNVTVQRVARDKFLKSVETNLELSRKMLSELSKQFMIYADRLDNLESKDAHERITHRLLFLAGRFGVKQGSAVIIKAPITHELIAESINLSRETVSREMEKLEGKKLISKTGKYIVISDVAAFADQFGDPVTLDLWGLDETSIEK